MNMEQFQVFSMLDMKVQSKSSVCAVVVLLWGNNYSVFTSSYSKQGLC